MADVCALKRKVSANSTLLSVAMVAVIPWRTLSYDPVTICIVEEELVRVSSTGSVTLIFLSTVLVLISALAPLESCFLFAIF
jgi:hypothetical protein